MTSLSEIYTTLMEDLEEHPGGALSQNHLVTLYEKRGLTEETARRARLATGRKERLAPAIERLLRRYPEEELQKAGLLNSKGFLPSRWIEDKESPNGKILVPYLDPTGEKVLYLRAHKMGPTGVELEVYGQHILSQGPEQVTITEGEFKALALIQSGIPALAIPGISSFAGKYFGKLQDLLAAHKVKGVVLLFDNEVKNDPSLPSYKEDPVKRWDTDYYAVRMARRLYSPELGIRSALVARLPDEWRINGKIDPDGALASGRSPEELRQVVARAVLPQQYPEQLPQEGRIVVGYKLARDQLYRSPLKEENGVYLWEQHGQREVISNFTLQPSRQIRRSAGPLERIYTAINTQGEQAEVTLKPAELVQTRTFKQALLNVGNYRWSGNQKQLDTLQERLFALASPRIATEAERFGRQDNGTWVFGDGIVQEGESFPLGEDGVVWGGSLSGVIPLEDRQSPIPRLACLSGSVPDICDLYEPLKLNLGTPAIGLALGWLVGCAFADEIFGEMGFFPLLGIFGAKGAGKTVAGRWLTSGAGLPAHGQNPLKLDNSTAKGLERTLGKFSSLPVWADEYRNDLNPRVTHGLRSVYDRSAGVQAEYSNDMKTRSVNIRACLLLSGEEHPTDPALLSRIVVVRLAEGERNVAAYQTAREVVEGLPLLFREALCRHKELLPEVMSCIHGAYDQLSQANFHDERMAWVYAVPLGVFMALLRHDPVGGNREERIMGSLYAWVEEEVIRLVMSRREDDHLARFFVGVNVLTTRYGPQGRSLVNRSHVAVSQDGATLFLWFPGVYREYALFERQVTGKTPFAEATLRSYLSECAYVAKNVVPRKLGGREQPSRKCVAVDLSHQETPELLKELSQKVSEPGWDRPDTLYDGPVENLAEQQEILPN